MRAKLTSDKINSSTLFIMAVLGGLFYFVPGQWISLQDDSAAYLYERGREGVMPGYPVFIDFFRKLLGQVRYLDGVVVAQSVLAMVCTFFFVMILRKEFVLKNWECILLYVISMLPFSIYLPDSGITHQIMTEGITYALFYLYFAAAAEAVWHRSYLWYVCSLIIAIIMGLYRSQMLFLQAVSMLVLLWCVYQKASKGFRKKAGALILGAVTGIVLAFLAYKTIYGIVAYDNRQMLKIQEELKAQMADGQTEPADETGGEEPEAVLQGQAEKPERVFISEPTSQFDNLLIARGFYEADREDVSLFDDLMMKEIFLNAYDIIAKEGHLYNYAKPGLYMWQDLVYDNMATKVTLAIRDYDVVHPDVRQRSEASIFRELGIRIIRKHFGRYLYHVFRLILPSMIAAVFFQIRPIYLLCHFIALFIYAAAIFLAVLVKKKNGNAKSSEFLLLTLVTILVMVLIVNVVFIGLQRYTVYGMGIFYCAFYLAGKEFIIRLYEGIKERS